MSNIGNKETMAKNLRYYLGKNNETQKELAEVVGVAASTLNDWVQAKKYPRIDKIEIIADHWSILKSDLIEDKTKESIEMQKNNDALADIVNRLYDDIDFQELNKILFPLDSGQIKRITQMIKGFM